jgi:hypothetical protein
MRWTSLTGRTDWVAHYVADMVARMRRIAPAAVRTVAERGPLVHAGRGTFYEVLDVAPDADGASVKAAYRALARRLHPDLNPGDAASAARLAEINRVYATLGDPAARAAYDLDLARRRVEGRRRWLAAVATSAATFATTVGLVWFAAGRHPAPTPEPAMPAIAMRAGPAQGKDSIPVAPPRAEDGRAADPAQAAIWETYRHPRFAFALRYPAGLFSLDTARSDTNVHTFVSRDGQAILRIVAAENTAAMTLADLRRALMKERYAGAQFKPAPRERHWFALSGTRGDEVFLERITFSCDGKAMHGWQLLYPSSRRSTYDELAKLILRNHPHGNGPAESCAPAKAQGKRQVRRLRD